MVSQSYLYINGTLGIDSLAVHTQHILGMFEDVKIQINSNSLLNLETKKFKFNCLFI